MQVSQNKRVRSPDETFNLVIDLGFYLPAEPHPCNGPHKRGASHFMCHSIGAAEVAAFITCDDKYAALAAIEEYALALDLDMSVGLVQSLKKRYGLHPGTTLRLLADIYKGWGDRPMNITEFKKAHAEYRELGLVYVE